MKGSSPSRLSASPAKRSTRSTSPRASVGTATQRYADLRMDSTRRPDGAWAADESARPPPASRPRKEVANDECDPSDPQDSTPRTCPLPGGRSVSHECDCVPTGVGSERGHHLERQCQRCNDRCVHPRGLRASGSAHVRDDARRDPRRAERHRPALTSLCGKPDRGTRWRRQKPRWRAAARDVLVPVLGSFSFFLPADCISAGIASVEADYAAALGAIPNGTAKTRGSRARRGGRRSDPGPAFGGRLRHAHCSTPNYQEGSAPGEYRYTPGTPFAFAPHLGEDLTPFVLKRRLAVPSGPAVLA